MLHLICSNVREHQKGKFIVLVTERDIVGASCYLKMINKNSYWFCKVNNSSCSSAGVGQWQGLAELLGTIHPPMGSQLYTSLHLQCIAFQLQLHCSAWCKDSPGAVTNLLQSCRLGWLNAALERGGHRKEGKGCFKNQTLQSLHSCFQHCAQKCSWLFQPSFWGRRYWETSMVPLPHTVKGELL